MRLPNSYGSITKLTGKRRKPFMVRITTGWELDEDTMKAKQVQKVLGYYATRKEAIAALAEYNDDPYDLTAEDVTLREIYERILPDVSVASIRNYTNAWKYLEPVQNMPIKAIKLVHLQKCIDDCQTTQQPMIATICHKIYRYALMHELTTKNPSQYLKAESKKAVIIREVFNSDEMDFLWDNTDKWWCVVTLILLYTGMRTKEFRTLSEADVDYNARWLEIRAAKNDCSVRGLPIHKRILPLFRAYFKEGGNLYGYSHANLNRLLHDFHEHKAHDARHSFATRMREVGTDELVIKRLLGHTPSDITQRIYTHLSQEELTAAIDKLEY